MIDCVIIIGSIIAFGIALGMAALIIEAVIEFIYWFIALSEKIINDYFHK